MALAGALEVQMFAELARLRQDMQQAKNMVGGAMESISKAAGMAQAALGALGLGLSVGALVEFARRTIDATDKLGDLSKSTNIAVGTLAGLEIAAKQSGGSLDSIAGGINKLSQNMGKEAEKFRALGITAKEPLEAFKQLADMFVALEDPQQRAAVMAAALGKSWAGAAPLLAEGGQKIGEMVERGRELSGVTTQLVNASDEFNDKLVLLTGTGGLMNRAIAPLLPLLNALADDMLDAQKKAGSLSSDGFNPLAETFRAVIILGGNVAFVFQAVGREIGGIIAQVNALGVSFSDVARGPAGIISALGTAAIKGELSLSRFSAISDAMKADAEQARKEFDAWEQKMLNVGTAAGHVTSSVKELSEAEKEAAKAASAAAAERAKAFLSNEKDAKAASAEMKLYLSTLQQLEQAMGGVVHQTEEQKRAYQIASGSLKTLTKDRAAHVLALAREVDAMKAAMKVAEERSAKRRSEEDAIRDYFNTQQEGYNAAVKASNDALAAAQAEYDQHGLSKSQIAEITLAKLESARASNLEGSAGYDAVTKQIEAQQQLIEVLKKGEARRAYEEMWRSVDRVAEDTFVNIFKSGKSAFEKLRDTLKDTLLKLLYQMTVQKWVFNIAASISGSMASGFANAAGNSLVGSLFGGSNGGSMLGGLGSMFGGWFGGGSGVAMTGAGGIGAASSLGASGLYAADAGYYGASAYAAGAGGGAGAGAGASSALGAIPVAGWIAMGMALSGSLYDKGYKYNSNMYAHDPMMGVNTGILKAFGISDKTAAMLTGSSILAALATKLGLNGGETRGGGQYAYAFNTDPLTSPTSDHRVIQNPSLGVNFLQGPSGGEIAGKEVRAAISNTVDTINGLLKSVGSAATLTAFQAGIETSDNDRGGVFAGGTLSTGKTFGISGDGSNYEGTMYDKAFTFSPDAQQAIKDFSTELTQTTLQALQAAADLPTAISDRLKDVDVKSLSADESTALLVSITEQIDEVNRLRQALDQMPFENLKNLSFDAADGLLRLTGGIDAFSAQQSAFYQNFYTDQERGQFAVDAANKQLTEGFSKLGITMPDTAQGYRDLMAAQDLSTESGRETYAALLNLSGAFTTVHGTAQQAAMAAAMTAGLQISLLEAQGFASAALAERRKQELAGMSATDAAIQQQIYAAQDAAKTRDLEIQLMELSGDHAGAVAAQRAIELAALSDTDKALQQRIWSLQDEAEAARAAAELAARNADLQDRLDVLRGTKTQQEVDRAHELANATDESTRELLRQIYAEEDLKERVAATTATISQMKEAMERWRDAMLSYQQAVAKNQGATDEDIAKMTRDNAWDKFSASLQGTALAGISAADALHLTDDQLAQLTPDQIALATAYVNADTNVKSFTKSMTESAAAAAAAAAVINTGWVNTQDVVSAAKAAFSDSFDLIKEKAATLADGDFGLELSGGIGGLQDYMAEVQKEIDYWTDWTSKWQGGGASLLAAQTKMEEAQKSMQQLMADYAKYTEYEAQYKGKGKDLLELDKWYEAQKLLFAGNQDDLTALSELYERKRLDIINGTLSEGLEETAKALRKWLDSMKLNSELSPLTAQQQLTAARQQYEMALASGDYENITQYAEAYLAAQKAVSGFGGDYTAIWQTIMDQIGEIAAPEAQPSPDVAPIVASQDRTTESIGILRNELRETKETLARLLEQQNRLVERQTNDFVSAAEEGSNATANAITKSAALTAKA